MGWAWCSRVTDLILLTFSGAHGTGKTTLVGDVRRELQRRYGRGVVFTVPSCSSRLFERIQRGSVELPEGSEVPASYDEIDELGLRAWFQSSLPSQLAFELETVVLEARQVRPPKKRVVALVDRWLPDIYAYTAIEESDARVCNEVLTRCRETHDALRSYLDMVYESVKVITVFVPLAASRFAIEGQDDKFRATCDRQEFEDQCLRNWTRVVPSLPSLTIASSGRSGRVAEVLSVVEEATARPAHRTTR